MSILSLFACLYNNKTQWHPTPVLLPGKSHGQRSLVGCSMGSQRVGHNWATSLSLFTFMHWRRKWQPTPVFLPGESQGRRSLVGFRLWGCTESDTTEVTYLTYTYETLPSPSPKQMIIMDSCLCVHPHAESWLPTIEVTFWDIVILLIQVPAKYTVIFVVLFIL